MDTAFFITSKLIGALIRPDTWIILALAMIVLALGINYRRLALWTGSVALALLVALSLLPLGDLLLQPVERTYPAQPQLNRVHGIIALGGSEDARASAYWDQMQLNEGGERYIAAMMLARRFPQARVLFTGGSGALRDLTGAETSEAAIAERFFLDQGIAPARILLEDQSRNTAEQQKIRNETCTFLLGRLNSSQSVTCQGALNEARALSTSFGYVPLAGDTQRELQ